MLDDTRNLIGDIASGKIKDQRLALLADELAASTRKLSDATAELAILESENRALKADVEQMDSTLNHFRLRLESEASGKKLLCDEAEKMLDVLFDADRALTVDSITASLEFKGGIAKHHLDTLLSERLVSHSGFEQQIHYIGQAPTSKPTYELTPSGRKQVVISRTKNTG